MSKPNELFAHRSFGLFLHPLFAVFLCSRPERWRVFIHIALILSPFHPFRCIKYRDFCVFLKNHWSMCIFISNAELLFCLQSGVFSFVLSYFLSLFLRESRFFLGARIAPAAPDAGVLGERRGVLGVRTSDTSDTAVWLLTMLMSLIALIGLGLRRLRKKI